MRTVSCGFVCVLVSLLIVACNKQQSIEYGQFAPEYYQQEIGFSVENPLAQQYLHDSDSAYSDGIGRYGISILDFYTLGQEKAPYLFNLTWHEDASPDWPQQPAIIKIASPGAREVWVSETPDFEDYQVFLSRADSTEIYNLVPQTVYWYRLVDSSDSVLYQSVFKTLGHLRMIKANNTQSVRDLGGWPCDGGRLAYGKIIRGGTPEREFDKLDLQQDILSGMIGIDYEIDLRRETELKACPFGSAVKFENIELAHYMNLIDNVHKDSHKNLARCLKTLNDNLQSDKCTFVHCHAGADRTGSLIAIIQALCGVSEKDIVRDWEINSFNSRFYFKIINQEKSSYKHIVDNVELADSAEMRSFLRYFFDNYGGNQGASLKEQVENWLKEIVFADEKDQGTSIIEGIRNAMIVRKVKSPMLVKEMDGDNYRVALDDVHNYKTIADSTSVTDSIGCTDLLYCDGYSSVWMNVVVPHSADFYDINRKKIGSITDAEQNIVNRGKTYPIPEQAYYVKFYMPIAKDWTAVLSADKI